VSGLYVADVGNTRIKWASVEQLDTVCAVLEDESDWERTLPSALGHWTIASVRPGRSQRFAGWLRERGHAVTLIERPGQIPLAVDLEHPERVGVDRLLNALAVCSRLRPGESAALIDAGSAVTVDLLDAMHTFRGGAIFPGLDLMARALHGYTALLPAVSITLPVPRLPGRSTVPALQAGIYAAVVGGIKECLSVYDASRVFLTGGQAAVLSAALSGAEVWPGMTLAGVAALVPEGRP
jgi:type III pantothenate kinase